MLREELETALDEYVGFPPDEVPKWVDWDIALGELLTVIDKYCWLKDERELPDITTSKSDHLTWHEHIRMHQFAMLDEGYKPVKPVLEKK